MYVNKKTQSAAISDSRMIANGSGNELLPFIQQDNQILIDARLLHHKLQVNSTFADWVKRKISYYGFKEGIDFFSNLRKSKTKPTTEYLLSLDMAKELAMLERNEIGRQIRRYFIAKEKELKTASHLPHDSELFKGLKAKHINNRAMYPYVVMLERCGYSRRSNSSSRKNRYWMHFVKDGNVMYITKEFALHLAHQKKVVNNRATLQNMQPVLPFDFGNTSLLQLNK